MRSQAELGTEETREKPRVRAKVSNGIKLSQQIRSQQRQTSSMAIEPLSLRA